MHVEGAASDAPSTRRRLLLVGLFSGIAPQVYSACAEEQAASLPGKVAAEAVAPGSSSAASKTAGMGEKPAGPEASGGPLSSVVPSSGEEAALKEGAKRKTVEQLQEEARRILEEEEAAAAAVKQQKRKNKLQELQEIRSSLNRKQVEILQKQQELLEKDQTVAVLTQELELERNLRELLIREKEKAEEQAKLALGLCGMNYLLP